MSAWCAIVCLIHVFAHPTLWGCAETFWNIPDLALILPIKQMDSQENSSRPLTNQRQTKRERSVHIYIYTYIYIRIYIYTYIYVYIYNHIIIYIVIYIYVIVRIGIHIRCKRMKHHCVFTARQSSNTVTSVYIICKKCEMQCQRPCCSQCAMASYSGATRPGHGSIPPRFRVTLPAVNSSGWSPLSGLVARGWTKYPEASQVIYIYLYIYFYLFIYTYIQYECLELPGISWIPEHHVPTRSNNIKWFQRSGWRLICGASGPIIFDFSPSWEALPKGLLPVESNYWKYQ